jgi:N-acetylmuramoyl-L-alanine amidase
MKIINHRLHQDDGTPVPFKPSPNFGEAVKPEYLVIHYTAGANAKGAVGWLINPNSKVSAHLVVGRDGSLTQLVPFDRVAWHAGVSQWEGRSGLNAYSIGIELDNAGRLVHKGGEWLASYGGTIADSQVIQAAHKNGGPVYGWQTYTEVQLETLLEASLVIYDTYHMLDVVGHDDIAPKRKVDPGPAFPMDSFRAKIQGREQETAAVFETTTNLPIRSGPGSNFKPLGGSPLPHGARLERIMVEGSWWFVDVIEEVNGLVDLQGWVNSRYVRRVNID